MHHLTRAQTIKRLQPDDDGGDDNLARTWLNLAFLWLCLGDDDWETDPVPGRVMKMYDFGSRR